MFGVCGIYFSVTKLDFHLLIVFETPNIISVVDGMKSDLYPCGLRACKCGMRSHVLDCLSSPECRTPIWRTHRYSNVVKTKHSQVEDVKKRIYGYEKTRKGNILLENGKNIDALSLFQQALQDNPGLMEAHLGIGRAFCAGRQYDKAIAHLSFIVERSSFSSAAANVVANGRGSGDAVERFYGNSPARASDSIAQQAIVQWAAGLAGKTQFASAVKLCDVVLGKDPQNQQAADVKQRAANGDVQLVVQAMFAEVGGRGHWYTCPNGHYYTIGECGRAMQVSKCPDCKSEVGGTSHRLLADNRPSNVDGSVLSAWPGN